MITTVKPRQSTSANMPKFYHPKEVSILHLYDNIVDLFSPHRA